MSKEVIKNAHQLIDPVSIKGVRSLKKFTKFVFVYPLTLLDHLFASRKSQVISVSGHEGLRDDLPLIIYVHYSSKNVVSEREKLTLRALQSIGFQTCLVMNINPNGPKVRHSIGNNRQFFDIICLRKNVGYDLGAYRDVLNFLMSHMQTNSKQIYFMNNSVIWFPKMIKTYFKELRNLDADVVAGSISFQYTEHIQTYLFGAKTENGLLAIQKWLFSIKNWRLKRSIVARGELNTNSILQSNLEVVTFPSDSRVKVTALRKLLKISSDKKGNPSESTLQRLQRNQDFAFAGIPVNPSHSFWLEKLENGFPGIKIDLVAKNPSGIQDYFELLTKLNDLGFGFDEINHLVYSNKNRSMTLRIRQLVKW